MLREENSFQIAGLRVAIAAVADRAAETAILIKKTRAVADEARTVGLASASAPSSSSRAGREK
jgi:hypothetical protein